MREVLFAALVAGLFAPIQNARSEPDLQTGQCAGLLGMYEFVGVLQPDSQKLSPGLAPNMALALYPDNPAAYDERISHYRLLQEQGEYRLELRTPHGIFGQLPISSKKDSLHCANGILTVERQRIDKVGMTYRINHYVHAVRKTDRGELEVDTDISGNYQGPLNAWPLPKQHYAIRFAPVD